MRFITRALPLVLLGALSACGVGGTTDCCVDLSTPSLRVINAFTTPMDVLIDGQIAISALAAGSVGKTATPSGNHTLVLRPNAGVSVSQSITTTTGALSTIAVVRTSSGSVSTAVLDDTNNVVPAGATKLRVLHLAPNAGVLQVYRTQPDYQTPIAWQFPFTYQASPNSLSAPFYQSTVGTWEVRIWQTPAGASGWATAPVKVVVPLGSGERKTIVILDQPGGGVKVEVL